MRLLLDESVPARFKRALPTHAVMTVVEMGWSGVRNGKLLSLAAGEFEAFITVDKNMQYQQNLAALPIALVVLDSLSTELPALLALVPKLEHALSSLEAKTYVKVGAGA